MDNNDLNTQQCKFVWFNFFIASFYLLVTYRFKMHKMRSKKAKVSDNKKFQYMNIINKKLDGIKADLFFSEIKEYIHLKTEKVMKK